MALNDEIDGAPTKAIALKISKSRNNYSKINNNEKLRYTLLTVGNIRKTNVTKNSF